MGTFIGQLILFGYTWALIHHMFGGIRHFIWDTGHGYGATEREWLVRAGLAGSIVTTVILWVVGYAVMGDAPMSIRTPHRAACAATARRDPAPRISGISASPRSPTCSLVTAFVVILVSLLGRSHAAVIQILASPARRDRDAAVRRLDHLPHEARHAGRSSRTTCTTRNGSSRRSSRTCSSRSRSRRACVYSLLKISFGV